MASLAFLRRQTTASAGGKRSRSRPRRRRAERFEGFQGEADEALPEPSAQPDSPRDLTSTRLRGNRELERTFDGKRLIRKGDEGRHVRLIQESLIAQGFAFPRAGADGIFGVETKATVKRYQELIQADKPDMKVDGIVGPQTLGELDRRDPTSPASLTGSTKDVRPPEQLGALEGELKPGDPGFRGGCERHFRAVSFDPISESPVGRPKKTDIVVPSKPHSLRFRTEPFFTGTAVEFSPKIRINAPDDATAQKYQVGFAQNLLSTKREAEYGGGGTMRHAVAGVPIRDAISPPSDAIFVAGAPNQTAPGLLEPFSTAQGEVKLAFRDPVADSFPFRLGDVCPSGGQLMTTMTLRDVFRTWVLVRHIKTGCIRPLMHFDWQTNWFARVRVRERADGTLRVRILNTDDRTLAGPTGDGSPPFVQGGNIPKDTVTTVCSP
jgi:peptidoglycan hydrolase-like protein with peptidoglycan-binding domain